MRKKPTKIMLAVLSRVPDKHAHWTSEIALDARRSVSSTYAALRRLEEHRLVEVVAGGAGNMPRSWRRTAAGRTALKEASSHAD